MTQEKKLKEVIRAAKASLKELEPYTTGAAQTALADMIRLAEEAAEIPSDTAQNCEGSLPFTAKREFGDWHWTKEDACRFALKRYTMVSVWLDTGSVYSTYGLEDALGWFREQDLRKPMKASELNPDAEGYLSLKETWEHYEKLCRDFLKDITFGDKIGQYSRVAGDRLIQALETFYKLCENLRNEELREAADAENDELCRAAAALADCLNALWELRSSAVLRSETGGADGGNILCNAEQMEEIRKKIDTDPLTEMQYQKIKEEADRASLEERRRAYRAIFEPDDYEKLNKEFVIETKAGNRPSFSVPEKTVSGIFSLVLPREDNEEDGLGHIQIRNIELKFSAGENIRLTADETVTLCNQSKDQEAEWTLQKLIPLSEDALYTIIFDAKQDGKLKKGMQIYLTFFDKDGNKLGVHHEVFNRKSWLNVKKYNLNTQCDAICYWYTKDKAYAEKSKIEMLHFLDDFCQGAHHWLRYNERPEGSDAYGGVQGGRDLFSIAVAYSMIRDSGVWSREERDRFYALISYLLYYLADLRDRTLMTTERTQRNSSNWQTDMHIGTAAILMAMPDFPNRKIWMYNSEAVLRAQLDFKLNADGSWPESLRYHFAALEHFSLYARLWERESGKNWFSSKPDTPGLAEMFSYPIYTQTPPYDYFDNCIAMPPFGDHKLGNGSEFAMCGLYCGQIAKYDIDIANKMYATWCRAKKPVKGLWGESVALDNLMYPGQTSYTFVDIDKKACTDNAAVVSQKDEKAYMAKVLSLTSTGHFPDSGIYIFRDGFGTPNENYLAVMSSPQRIGHGHFDQGAFVYYYHCVPIVMDSGIEGYFDASTPWHICSYSHAVMQFAAENKEPVKKTEGFINLSAGTYSLERGWNDGPYYSRVTELCISDGISEYNMGKSPDTGRAVECAPKKACEYISLEIENPRGSGIDHRTISVDHSSGIVTVTDRVADFSGEVLFNLPILAKSVTQNGNDFIADCYGGITVKAAVHSKLQSAMIETGRATLMAPGASDHTDLWYIRLKAMAEDGFMVTIEPHE